MQVSSFINHTDEANNIRLAAKKKAEAAGRAKFEKDFHLWMDAVRARALKAFNGGPVFTTDIDTDKIVSAYVNSFPDPADKQYHNCNCCKKFIHDYGNLVVLDDHDKPVPLLCSTISNTVYDISAVLMTSAARNYKITGVFYHDNQILGTPEAGGWGHMWLTQQKRPDHTLTAYQRMAEKKESYKNMRVALACWGTEQLEQVVQLLQSETLYRSEKVLGQAEFLLKMKGLKDRSVFWKEIALAPEGFMHPRSSMIGSLLEDLEKGFTIARAAERFKEKMHPLQYQRPTAPLKPQNIEQAEAKLKALGAVRSLERRFATMEDCSPFWLPKVTASNEGSVFAHLKKAAVTEDWSGLPILITWEKFKSTVLDRVDSMSIYTWGRNSYSAFLSAVHKDAPNILQWDSDVSWYFHNGGSTPETFNLKEKWSPVKALLWQPSMPLTHQGKGVMFAIEGAYERTKVGLCLFPEILKAEFHDIRSVIEAHSASKYLTPTMDQVAGLMFKSGAYWDCTVRVKTGSLCQTYKIDRWD